MIEEMRPVLDRLETALRASKARVADGALRPGREHASTTALLRSLGLPSNPAVQALYAWHDGTHLDDLTIGEAWLYPGFYFPPLSHASGDYEALRRDNRWAPNWFPLFADGGGDFMVLDVQSEVDAPIRHFRIDETEHPVEYGSLLDMMNTLVRGYDDGAILLSEDGYLDIDDTRYAEIAAELNPGVAWWNDPV